MRLRHLFLGAVLLVPVSAHASLTIKAAPTANVTCGGDTCTATAADATLNIKTLKTMLGRGNATVASGSLAQDIEIGTALPWTSANTLTLDAYRSIRIERPVSVQGTGGLTLITNDGGTGGDLSFPQWGSVTFLDLSSALTIDGHAYTLVPDVATLVADTNANFYSGYYALAADYDAGADGTYATTPVYQLNDAFEGLGHSISNLHMSDPGTGKWIGMIRYIKGSVRNLSLPDASVTGWDNGGALSYENDGLVSRVAVTGSVHINAGGAFALYNRGTIAFSHSDATVNGGGLIGGLSWTNSGTIMQSFVTGSVTSGGRTGGFVSDNSGIIADCYSRGDVSGGTGTYSGGFVGLSDESGAISQTYETGAVSGGGTHGGAGGFAGQNYRAAITAAYWDETTTGLKGKSNGTGDHKQTTGITPTTSAKLKMALPDGFDPAIWGLDHAINAGFPYLLNNPGQPIH